MGRLLRHHNDHRGVLNSTPRFLIYIPIVSLFPPCGRQNDTNGELTEGSLIPKIVIFYVSEVSERLTTTVGKAPEASEGLPTVVFSVSEASDGLPTAVFFAPETSDGTPTAIGEASEASGGVPTAIVGVSETSGGQKITIFCYSSVCSVAVPPSRLSSVQSLTLTLPISTLSLPTVSEKV